MAVAVLQTLGPPLTAEIGDPPLSLRCVPIYAQEQQQCELIVGCPILPTVVQKQYKGSIQIPIHCT